MVRRHLVRGYNEKIFFAESSGNYEKIYQIEPHISKANEITKREIWQLAGSWLVALESDGQCIQNDMEDGVVQSLFIMDNKETIYQIKNENDVRFELRKTIDFSHHKKLSEVNTLLHNDWARVHISERSITFGGTTYNFQNHLSIDVKIPSVYFGTEKELKAATVFQVDEQEEAEDVEDDGDDDMNEKKEDVTADWMV